MVYKKEFLPKFSCYLFHIYHMQALWFSLIHALRSYFIHEAFTNYSSLELNQILLKSYRTQTHIMT